MLKFQAFFLWFLETNVLVGSEKECLTVMEICGPTKCMAALIVCFYSIIVIMLHYLFIACLERFKSKIMTNSFSRNGILSSPE